jgi:hypothetical protein
VKTTPHTATGNNAQARGKLQITDVTEQRANKYKKQAAAIKHLEIKIQF